MKLDDLQLFIESLVSYQLINDLRNEFVAAIKWNTTEFLYIFSSKQNILFKRFLLIFFCQCNGFSYFCF